MTNLEIALSIAEFATLAALVRIYRKQMIVRHLFIQFSDWTARKIDEMTEGASWEITELQKAVSEERGYPIADDKARDSIPYVILHAKAEWQDQADYFQAMLRRNGMPPLTEFDLDTLVLNPKIAGFKRVPMPRPRAPF